MPKFKGPGLSVLKKKIRDNERLLKKVCNFFAGLKTSAVSVCNKYYLPFYVNE